MTTDIAGSRGRCWGCGYQLQGISSRRCPECGKEFDPDDLKTMNMSGATNPLARWLITRPLGPLVLTGAFAASSMIAATTRLPVGDWDFTLADLRRLWRHNTFVGFWRTMGDQTWPDLVLVSAVELWALLVAVMTARTILRGFLSRRYHGQGVIRAARKRIRAFFALLLLSTILLPLGSDFRLAKRWTSEVAAGRPASLLGIFGAPHPFNSGVSPSREDDVLRTGMRRLGAAERIFAAGIVVETRAPRGLPLLLEAYLHESDADVRAALLTLIGMFRDTSAAATLVAALDDPAPQVRIAAVDALGILYAPPYPIPLSQDWFSTPSFEPNIHGTPATRIDLSGLIEHSHLRVGVPPSGALLRPILEDTAIPLPQNIREKLRQMKMGEYAVTTAAQREAAARALLRWPPPGYSLRVAEWGVWINDGGELKLAQSVLDEIPPFVHRIGNPRSELVQRVNKIMIVTKPIIHITASTAMSVDVTAEITDGRPWFAYPRPDDFTVTAGDVGDMILEKNPDGTDKLDPAGNRVFKARPPTLAGLDPVPAFPRLENSHQGYPGMFPGIPVSGSIGGGMGSKNDIIAAGVRWQSAIVTPEQPAWAKMATVPAGEKYQWWSRLRKVQSSYVTSRGETERFLYYDGPTNSPSPLTVSLPAPGETLRAVLHWKDPWPINPQWRSPDLLKMKQSKSFPRAAMLVRVRAGRAQAILLSDDVLKGESATLQIKEPVEDAPALLMKLLTDAGLTPDEAQGLIDAWTPQFFQTEGDRFLIRFSSSEYDIRCPIEIRPLPTTLVRVGLLLTELGKP